MRSLGITLSKTRFKVEQLTGFGPGATDDEVIIYSPRAQRVVVLSSEEALELGSKFIDTEHLLLALIQEEDSIAAKVLKSLGVEIKQVRTELYKAMNE
jgi:ATP-dependent Clp protease ATP-binding subunit ClpC